MSAPDKEKEKDKEETNQKSEDLGLLEEDDEFEEFPAEGKNLFLFLLKYVELWDAFRDRLPCGRRCGGAKCVGG